MRRGAVALMFFAAACSATPIAGSAPPEVATPTASATASATAQPAEVPSAPVVVPTAADVSRAHEVMLILADEIGRREAGSAGDAAARERVAGWFRAAGLQVISDEFPLPQGGSTSNIIGVRDLADLDRPHIVVGAHLDTRGGGPGANDNATGVGVIVSLVERLAAEALAVPVVFVAFGAEEFQPATPRLHHIGSRRYADARGDLVAAALSIDMVGNGDQHCICWLDVGPRTLADRLMAVAESEGSAGEFFVEARGDISDHGPFARAGRPAAFLWSGPDETLHTPRDTSDRVDPDDVRRAEDLAMAWIRSLTAADVPVLQAQP